MDAPSADAWELAGFPGRLNVAAYLTPDQLAAEQHGDVGAARVGLTPGSS